MATYVQYGCGPCAPEGWLNFDASPRLLIRSVPVFGKMFSGPFRQCLPHIRFGDVTRRLLVSAASADAIYCSHVLEHLALEDCRLALKNSYRMLRPGGVFRMVLPDLRSMAESYVSSRTHESAIQFMTNTGLGRLKRPRGLSVLLTICLGKNEHYWFWDFESLSAELKMAGFDSIRRAACGDTGDEMFARVENPERFESSLAIHCIRPV